MSAATGRLLASTGALTWQSKHTGKCRLTPGAQLFPACAIHARQGGRHAQHHFCANVLNEAPALLEKVTCTSLSLVSGTAAKERCSTAGKVVFLLTALPTRAAIKRAAIGIVF